jgi:4-hydroxy-tetrahydrodipicolinate reductase
MPYRVIQWGTGNVGLHSLRSIIERPDLELAGLRVYSKEKVGKDAGELAGVATTGILATDDVDEILAIEADCVNYNSLGTTEDMMGEPLDNLCLLLSHGYNVTSTAIDFTVFPPSAPAEMRRRLEKACTEGGTTYFGSGVNPGYTMDLWPVTMSRLSRRIDRIKIVETLDMRDLSSASTMAFMGFGQQPGGHSLMDDMHTDPANSVTYSSLLLTANALRFDLEDYRYEREVGLAESRFEIASGVVEVGTIAVVRLRFLGFAYGREVLDYQFVWRVTDDVNPEWGTGEYWTMEIEGDPSMKCVVEASTTFDSGRIVSLTVAMAALNAIPTACEASPGVKSVLDLPTWGGGYVGPDTVS